MNVSLKHHVNGVTKFV